MKPTGWQRQRDQRFGQQDARTIRHVPNGTRKPRTSWWTTAAADGFTTRAAEETKLLNVDTVNLPDHGGL